MFATGIIQENDYQAALKTPVKAAGNKNTASKSPYFVEYAKRDLEKNLGPSQLYKGGLNIYSTLSFEMQSAAEIAVRKGLADLESRMKRQAAALDLSGDLETVPLCARQLVQIGEQAVV